MFSLTVSVFSSVASPAAAITGRFGRMAAWQVARGMASDSKPPTPPKTPGAAQPVSMLTPEEDAMIKVTHDKDDNGELTGVVTMSFNMPDRLNALTVDLGRVFEKKIRTLRKDSTIRAMILTGEGTAFSAGGDLDFLTARASDSMAQNQVMMRRFYDRFLSVRRCPFPVIAAINGPAIGAGACLSMACDVRMAATGAKIGFNFVNIGIPPGMGGSHFVPLLTNHQVAARLFLTGDILKAEEMQQLGAVLSVHPPAELLGAALKMARKIAQASPVAVRSVVQTLRLQGDMGLSKDLDREAEQQAIAYASGHVLEGVAAIREKRAPVFRDAQVDATAASKEESS
eukprot:comp21034_c1_seq1/m.28260 comp21034_c1_seq1/g.28260  ORF comp21034_c1_seq1/g.28260 comp21034_c1_seq1/m.28260 type:complete len:342 (-) comp21034_c1_seq1:191-1216(-)